MSPAGGPRRERAPPTGRNLHLLRPLRGARHSTRSPTKPRRQPMRSQPDRRDRDIRAHSRPAISRPTGGGGDYRRRRTRFDPCRVGKFPARGSRRDRTPRCARSVLLASTRPGPRRRPSPISSRATRAVRRDVDRGATGGPLIVGPQAAHPSIAEGEKIEQPIARPRWRPTRPEWRAISAGALLAGTDHQDRDLLPRSRYTRTQSPAVRALFGCVVVASCRSASSRFRTAVTVAPGLDLKGCGDPVQSSRR